MIYSRSSPLSYPPTRSTRSFASQALRDAAGLGPGAGTDPAHVASPESLQTDPASLLPDLRLAQTLGYRLASCPLALPKAVESAGLVLAEALVSSFSSGLPDRTTGYVNDRARLARLVSEATRAHEMVADVEVGPSSRS